VGTFLVLSSLLPPFRRAIFVKTSVALPRDRVEEVLFFLGVSRLFRSLFNPSYFFPLVDFHLPVLAYFVELATARVIFFFFYFLRQTPPYVSFLSVSLRRSELLGFYSSVEFIAPRPSSVFAIANQFSLARTLLDTLLFLTSSICCGFERGGLSLIPPPTRADMS